MNLKYPTGAIQGESSPYWCPSAYWPSYKSDPVCQGAATINMKLVRPYRGPWASQRWTAIWRLCRPFCVVFPTFLEQLLKIMIAWSGGIVFFFGGGIFWYQDRKKMNPFILRFVAKFHVTKWILSTYNYLIIYLKTAVIVPVPESESAESLSCSWSVQFYIKRIGPNQSGRFEALWSTCRAWLGLSIPDRQIDHSAAPTPGAFKH